MQVEFKSSLITNLSTSLHVNRKEILADNATKKPFAPIRTPHIGPTLDKNNDQIKIKRLETYASFSSEKFINLIEEGSTNNNCIMENSIINAEDCEMQIPDYNLNIPPKDQKRALTNGFLEKQLKDNLTKNELESMMDLFV